MKVHMRFSLILCFRLYCTLSRAILYSTHNTYPATLYTLKMAYFQQGMYIQDLTLKRASTANTSCRESLSTSWPIFERVTEALRMNCFSLKIYELSGDASERALS